MLDSFPCVDIIMDPIVSRKIGVEECPKVQIFKGVPFRTKKT
jgi:hypothetical protein